MWNEERMSADSSVQGPSRVTCDMDEFNRLSKQLALSMKTIPIVMQYFEPIEISMRESFSKPN